MQSLPHKIVLMLPPSWFQHSLGFAIFFEETMALLLVNFHQPHSSLTHHLMALAMCGLLCPGIVAPSSSKANQSARLPASSPGARTPRAASAMGFVRHVFMYNKHFICIFFDIYIYDIYIYTYSIYIYTIYENIYIMVYIDMK